LRRAALARRYASLLPDAQRRLVEPIFEEWDSVDWSTLRTGVIHGDANDYNIVVDAGGSRVTSLLDFGDMVHTATVCDLAIALAYVMLDEQDPIAAAAQVVAGYHRERPLDWSEIAVLYRLARTRLAMSVCNCAWQASQAPHNEYLHISNRPAWALL